MNRPLPGCNRPMDLVTDEPARGLGLLVFDREHRARIWPVLRHEDHLVTTFRQRFDGQQAVAVTIVNYGRPIGQVTLMRPPGERGARVMVELWRESATELRVRLWDPCGPASVEERVHLG